MNFASWVILGIVVVFIALAARGAIKTGHKGCAGCGAKAHPHGEDGARTSSIGCASCGTCPLEGGCPQAEGEIGGTSNRASV